MNRIAIKKMVLPIIILFVMLNGICIIFGKRLDKNNIDHIVLLYANLLFFILGLITAFLHTRALKNSNAYAFVRSIMLGSFIKLIVIAAAVLLYLLKSGENKSIYAVIVALVIYVFYAVIEVRAAMYLNKNSHA